MIAVPNVDDIQYESNYLSEVVVRVDFASPISGIENKLSSELEKAVMHKFPIAEPQKFVIRGLQWSGKEMQQASSAEGFDWYFHNKDRSATISIQQQFFWIKYNAYRNFESLTSDFGYILDNFCKSYPDSAAARFGLRYINNIQLESGSPFEWKDYIHDNMLAILDIAEKNLISRAFQTLELNYEDVSLRFQFGMNNPDYPALIKKKHFILDYDAYHMGYQEKDEIKQNLQRAHARIQTLFEASIKNSLRDKMKTTKVD